MRSFLVTILSLLVAVHASGQSTKNQTIAGQVIDHQSGQVIAYANIVAIMGDSMTGTVSDLDGHFEIDHLAVGRYDVKVSYVGYRDLLIADVFVKAHLPTVLDIRLEQSPFILDEVTVKPLVDKRRVKNEQAVVSGRLLSVEEANRYAGGFDDPARLASAFAGVSSNIQSNGIVIRGNAPKYLQWKMEGIEIPNPNHFADLSAFGGGGLTALSSQVMDNTDFLTGAMPATYDNALSGVFDLTMRNGHNKKAEHQVQVGIIGIDLATEGSLSEKNKASYLLNYRYSTLGLVQSLLPDDAGKINYQDLSFKVTWPSLEKGTFTWWGLGLRDFSGQEPEYDQAEQIYEQNLLKQSVRQNMGATGIKYARFLNNKTKQIIKSQLAITANNTNLETRKLNITNELRDENRITNSQGNLHFNTELNSQFSKRHSNLSGFKIRYMFYNLGLDEAQNGDPLNAIVDEMGQSTLSSLYSSSIINISPRSNLIFGINSQYFSLNKEWIFEPRLAISFQYREKIKLGLAYGRHSRLEPLPFYFTRDATGHAINSDLKFSKSHHIVGSIQWIPRENYSIKIEPYFQYLFDIPVSQESQLSFINLENDWFLNEALQNSGQGRNTGLDLTLERYIQHGFYGLFTLSVFDSKFRNKKDQNWSDTRYNSNFLCNFLIGKEFTFGANRQKSFGINYRVAYQGGIPYTPILEAASLASGEIIFDDGSRYRHRFAPSIIHHVTINYVVNRARVNHVLSLKVLNAGGYKEFDSFRINTHLNTIDEYREALVIPNLSYKISF